ncbi:MAG: amidohydrolase family protein [bacterium]|nr:amidohydrolase family protein [bacterium]
MAGQLVDAHYHITRTGELTRYKHMEELLDYKEKAGLRAVCIHNIIFFYSSRYLRNPLSLLAKAKSPKDLYVFGGLVFPEPQNQTEAYPYKEEVQKLLEMGCDGIKFLNKPLYKKEWSLPYYHENFDEMWDYLQKEQTPLMFHVGDPKEFWLKDKIPKVMYDAGWFYDESVPSYASFYEETDKILQKFPHLNLTIPHFYFLSDNLKRLRRFMEAYPNVQIDITPGSEMYYNFSVCQDEARAFFMDYHDRILFGTDNFGSQSDGDWGKQLAANQKKIEEMRAFLRQESCHFDGADLNGLHLTEAVVAEIESENFFRWLPEEPKKVNLPAVEKMAEELLEKIKKKGDCPQVIPEFERTIEELRKIL